MCMHPLLFIDWHSRQRCHFRPCGNDDILRVDDLGATIVERDLNLVGANNLSPSLDVIDLRYTNTCALWLRIRMG